MVDLRKLKNEASDAAAKSNWKKAASAYATLEQHEHDALWPLKLGECLRKLGHNVEAIKALTRAVDIYAKADLLLKAIAVCKIILDIDPNHTKTQQALAAFHASRSGTPSDAAALAPALMAANSTLAKAPAAHARGGTAVRRPALPLADAGEAPIPHLAPLVAAPPSSKLPPGLLQEMSLAAMLPGARQSSEVPAVGDAAALEIPIDLDLPDFQAGEEHDLIGRIPPSGPRTTARVVLPKTPFFSVLTEAQLCVAIERVRLVQLEAGQILFATGDAGDALYVVASGEIAVLVPQEVARLQEGDFFRRDRSIGSSAAQRHYARHGAQPGAVPRSRAGPRPGFRIAGAGQGVVAFSAPTAHRHPGPHQPAFHTIFRNGARSFDVQVPFSGGGPKCAHGRAGQEGDGVLHPAGRRGGCSC
jgi:tetratricopeptide (TPR) repeat protein